MLGRQRRARGGQGVALLLLLARQIQRLERKPPVTLALMAIMCYLHVQHARYERWFKPLYLIIYGGELSRVVASAFLHVDDLHLYHNMMSFLWKGYNLEHKLGGLKFLAVVGFLLVLSHALVVVVALALASLFHEPAPLHQCSIGFSGVLFALKVLLNHDSPATSSVYGFRVPTKYAAWLELVVIHVLVPRSSFMGHMCGILAGYMYVYSPGIQRSLSTVVRAVEQFARALLVPAARVEPRSGTAPRSPAATARENTRFESDEELARRLQEEEFLAAEARPRDSSRGSRGNPIPVDIEPQPIDANELRRRRLARFGGASR